MIDEIHRKTGQSCLACNTGNLIENIRLHSKIIGQPLLGGRNSVSRWISSQFHCDHCGHTFVPTKANKLVEFGGDKMKERIESLLVKYSEQFLARSLGKSKFFVTMSDPNFSGNIPSLLSQDGRVFVMDEDVDLFHFRNTSSEQKKVFLIQKENGGVELFDQKKEWRKQWEKTLELIKKKAKKIAEEKSVSKAVTFVNKKFEGLASETEFGGQTHLAWTCWENPPIPMPEIPANATLAEEVYLFDDDFHHACLWIPKDAVERKA